MVLASINLSETETWNYPLKTLPRPTGRATEVIITEYDLPRREAQPHDVIVDKDGQVWYSDFGAQFVGELAQLVRAQLAQLGRGRHRIKQRGCRISIHRQGITPLGRACRMESACSCGAG